MLSLSRWSCGTCSESTLCNLLRGQSAATGSDVCTVCEFEFDQDGLIIEAEIDAKLLATFFLMPLGIARFVFRGQKFCAVLGGWKFCAMLRGRKFCAVLGSRKFGAASKGRHFCAMIGGRKLCAAL